MKTLLLGHRGSRGSGHMPENTLTSFELCMEHGCDGFEFDVRRSADGFAVVCHDPTFRSLEIERATAKQLALPTLKEVLQHFSHRAFLDIELKVPGLDAQVIASVREHPPKQGFVVSSFLPDVLTAIYDLDPTIPLGFLFDRQNQRPPLHLRVEWTIPHFKLVNRQLVEQVHVSGEKIMVWTVNRLEQIQQFIDWGVDAVISDETGLLARFRR
jgi:glycerophosphoryl diester phosphodiesterase